VELLGQTKGSPPEANHAGSEKNTFKRRKTNPAGSDKKRAFQPPPEAKKEMLLNPRPEGEKNLPPTRKYGYKA
jgi:hypothetical protein